MTKIVIVAGAVVLAGVVLVLTLAGRGPYDGPPPGWTPGPPPSGGIHASPVRGARITFTVAPAHQANYPPCCELTVTNTTTRTLYGFSCHLVAVDRAGHVLWNGEVDADTPGLQAPPGETDGGFLAIGIRHPDRIASSNGQCDAWDWGSGGPPP